MKAIHRKRLLRLAEYLETVPEHRFNLSSWKGCGSTACAVGHACDIPEFKDDGLWYDGQKPRFRGDTSWPAVEKFFGLGWHEAEWLFDVDEYPLRFMTGPEEVSERIRSFVASKESAHA